MEPVTTSPPERNGNRWRGKPGLVAALATVVAATAVAVVAGRSEGNSGRPDPAAAVRQVVVPPPATTPPVTEAPAPAPPPEPVTSSSSTTTLTVAQPPRPAAAAPKPAAARQPAPPPVPLTLSAALQQALAGVNGCLIVEDQDSATTTVFDSNSGAAFTPASSQKLLVAAAALSRLGPNFRFETKVVAARPPQDGTLDDAWLVGGGDPYLATPDYAAYLATKPRTVDLPTTPLTALADELVAMGVRNIPGGLHTDESRYEPQRSVPSWKPSYVAEAEVGSFGALTVNEGLAGWGPNQKVAPDPAVSAATALGRLLGDRGVALPGPTAGGKAPPDGVLIASLQSAPLSQIVAGMLRASDNYIAEMLVKELDRQYGGPGLTAGGTARVVEEIGRLGVPIDGVHLADGSGLDVGNRATCRALLGTLNLSKLRPFSVLDSGLAIAGHTGTLAKRYVGSPADTRLAAKTGWINGCAAMVGRIVATGSQPIRRFALIFNGRFGWPAAQAIQDKVVGILTSNLAPWP